MGNGPNALTEGLNELDPISMDLTSPRDIKLTDEDTGLDLHVKLGPKALLIIGGFLANFVIGLVNLITRLAWG